MKFERLSEGHRFLEAPRMKTNGDLYFTDLVAGGIYKRSPEGGISHFLRERRWIGGLVFNHDGGLICSGLGGLLYFDEVSGSARPLLTQIAGVPIIAVNDIYADDHGSIYGGTVDFVSIEKRLAPTPGVLFRLDPPDRLTVLYDANVSNGIGLSPDRSVLYHSETSVGVWAGEIDSERKILSKTLFAHMSDSDGLVVDSAGGVWVAALESGKLIRFRSDGVRDFDVELPVKEAVSLTFGGADMRDLYVVAGGDIYDSVQRRAAVYRGRSPVAGQVNPKAKF